MSGPPTVTKQLASSESQDGHFTGSTLSDYWALTKPEVNFLILITTGVGFYLGCGSEARPFSLISLFNTLLGTLLVASGTGTLNQYIERNFDAQMRRPGLRNCAGSIRNRLSCRWGQPARELARGFDIVELSVPVYPIETKNTVMRSGGRLSRCHATADRLGRRLPSIELRR